MFRDTGWVLVGVQVLQFFLRGARGRVGIVKLNLQ